MNRGQWTDSWQINCHRSIAALAWSSDRLGWRGQPSCRRLGEVIPSKKKGQNNPTGIAWGSLQLISGNFVKYFLMNNLTACNCAYIHTPFTPLLILSQPPEPNFSNSRFFLALVLHSMKSHAMRQLIGAETAFYGTLRRTGLQRFHCESAFGGRQERGNKGRSVILGLVLGLHRYIDRVQGGKSGQSFLLNKALRAAFLPRSARLVNICRVSMARACRLFVCFLHFPDDS